MNKVKLAASVVALLVATFVVIRAAAANAEPHATATNAAASAQSEEVETSPALPLEQD